MMTQLEEEQLQLDEVTQPPEIGTTRSSSCSKTNSSATAGFSSVEVIFSVSFMFMEILLWD
jgi:hypothetical protein